MICKCGTRMKCFESHNMAAEQITGRRYRCPACNKRLLTLEKKAPRKKVGWVIDDKRRIKL